MTRTWGGRASRDGLASEPALRLFSGTIPEVVAELARTPALVGAPAC